MRGGGPLGETGRGRRLLRRQGFGGVHGCCQCCCAGDDEEGERMETTMDLLAATFDDDGDDGEVDKGKDNSSDPAVKCNKNDNEGNILSGILDGGARGVNPRTDDASRVPRPPRAASWCRYSPPARQAAGLSASRS